VASCVALLPNLPTNEREQGVETSTLLPVVDRTQPAPPAKSCRLVAAAGCGSCRPS
jgi:hypothetical protein